MEEERIDLLRQIWHEQDQAYALMSEYDSLPHRYGEMFLFQAETQLISMVAVYPDITITDMANILKKTPSACSQIVRKLCEKKLVEQIRDKENKRRYKLRLTPKGEQIYQDHAEFEQECQQRTFEKLKSMSLRELELGLELQRRLNEAYQEDVRRSREHFV